MTKKEYIICICKILRKLNKKQLKKVFEYAHMLFINDIGN